MTQTEESQGVYDAFKQQATESTTPLAASAVFTGPWIDLGAGGGRISATSRADQAGTLTIQESVDGVTAGAVIGSAATVSLSGTDFATATGVTAKEFVRVVYTNGSAAQTTFELDRYADC